MQSFILSKFCTVYFTCISKKLFIETWNLKICWSTMMGISRLLILAFQNRTWN